MVVDRLAAYRLVDVGQAAEFVEVVLEGVGVDRAERYTKISRVVPEPAIVLDLVPRDVQCNLRREAGQLVHLGSVGELFLNGPRRAWRAEDLEPGAGVAERPGGQLDGLIGQLVGDVGEGWHVLTHFQESRMERVHRCGAPKQWAESPRKSLAASPIQFRGRHGNEEVRPGRAR